jgi:hypothetical protein
MMCFDEIEKMPISDGERWVDVMIADLLTRG